MPKEQADGQTLACNGKLIAQKLNKRGTGHNVVHLSRVANPAATQASIQLVGGTTAAAATPPTGGSGQSSATQDMVLLGSGQKA